jgi:NitT/TauT family transport system substrate-binding protein
MAKGAAAELTVRAHQATLTVSSALAKTSGLDPNKDITIVVAGEAGQTAALVNSHQVDALAQFDTQYALTENAGAKLRPLEDANKTIHHYPANGFVVLEDTLAKKRADMIALGKGYAMGEVYAFANPEAAIRILWEVFPQTKPTGKDEATALKHDLITLKARMENWKLSAGGVTKWGESNVANYDSYVDFLVKNGVVKQKQPATDLVTNDLIADINKFDEAEVQKLAKNYK